MTTEAKISMRRKPLAAAGLSLVHARAWSAHSPMPWLVEPALAGVDLVAYCTREREALERKLHEHGAILFRGFDVSDTEHFERIIAALTSGALEYMFRASPRTRVAGNIYTSTDYPADQVIFPHNEHSYSPRFPLRLFFYCQTPSATGGATPIGSTRELLRRLSPVTVERFRKRKVLYVRNYGDGMGLPWQTVFQTTEPREVDAYCETVGISTEWKSAARLRTSQVGPALVRHPHTGEEVWFNHATFFHVSTLPEAVGSLLTAAYDERDLPTNTFYGDGEPIERETLEELREAYRGSLVTFPWQRGDVLFIDNMLCTHGRESFSGARSILTGMADPIYARDVGL